MRYTLDYEKYASLARQAAAEGCVLLRNEEEALPIRDGERVSVFGRAQFHYYKSGTGSGGMVNVPYVSSIPDSLRENGVRIEESSQKRYREWLKENPFDAGAGWAQEPWSQKEMPVSRAMAEEAAAVSDLALVILGRTAGEDNDNSETPGSYLLTREEESLLETVCSVFRRTAVVLNVGNIIDMKWVNRYRPQAVLYVWQGGMEGGRGAADVLCGKVSPCGKLVDTIAADIGDYPSSAHFGDPERNFYAEDIYVGYRYFETFAPEKVLYPFGFGLSYTRFSISAALEEAKGETVRLCVRIKNEGETAGREVVQLYLSKPQGQLGQPARSLIGFGKTTLLPPGEEEELEFSVPLAQAASFDDSGVTGHKNCFVLEAGEYGVFVGNSVRDAKKAGSFTVDELRVVEECEEAMAPVLPYSRLRPSGSGPDEKGRFEEEWEETPLRTQDPMRRALRELPREAAYTGDRGIRLADVCDKKVSMEDFLAQLSDEDLACMVRGEGMCSPKVTPGTAAAFGGVTQRLQDFGIPVACCSDGPSGIRMDCGTLAFSLPNGTLLACTFNLPLVEELYRMEGMELRKNRIDTLLGPGMNLHRNPLNGRNFEYFSEDPLLTGRMAAAQLKGMAKYGVTGTIKHFACNNQEYRRHDADSVVSQRALRELYLKSFEIAVREGGAYSIMSTYGPVNGIWTAGNYDLLTVILRKEWGYRGLVMTDWWAKMNDEGGEGTKENTAAMVRAQNDVYMVVSDAASNSGKDNTMQALKKGIITRAQLVRNAGNICNFLMRSPVMNRFLDREFDHCEVKSDLADGASSAAVLDRVRVDGRADLDVSALSTQKGTAAAYTLTFETPGKYRLSFLMKSDAGELAQMPMSVFVNNQLACTITITGSGGMWLERTAELDATAGPEHYLKLFFGESGISIGRIWIEKI